MESVMRRYEHRRNVGAVCDACGKPVHLARREDGGWFWMHDSAPSRAQVAARLIGGAGCTPTT